MKYQEKGLSLKEWDERWYESYWLITRQQPDLPHLKACEMATDLMVKYHGHKPVRQSLVTVPEGKTMGGLFRQVLAKFLKGKWEVILSSLLKAAGEGKFGPRVQKGYWLASKYAFQTGLVFWLVGGALDMLGTVPGYEWAKSAAFGTYAVGGVLNGCGLLVGTVNSPWPTGAKELVHPQYEVKK